MNKPSDEGQGHPERMISYLETDNGQRIAVCAFSVIATLALMAFEGEALAYVFGLPYMFFIPGFAVVRLFFWKDTSPEMRFVLSLGLSIIVVILLGLILVLTPIGLEPNTTRASLILFTIGAVALETLYPWKGKTPKPKEEAHRPPGPPVKVDKVVAAMLAVALVISGISLGLIITAEYPSRTYFAMTDENGMMFTNTSGHLNTNITVNVHMKNGDDGPRVFTLVAYGPSVIGDRETQTFQNDMAEDELWTQAVVFELSELGYLRIDLDLYVQDGDEPPILYGNLHMWLEVVD